MREECLGQLDLEGGQALGKCETDRGIADFLILAALYKSTNRFNRSVFSATKRKDSKG